MTAAEGADRVTDEFQQLRKRVTALDQRLDRLETAIWTTGVAVGIVALLAGLVLPFLTYREKDDYDSIGLLPMIFASKQDADNGGPFSGEANLLSVLLGVLVAFTVAMIVVLAALSNRRMAPGPLKVSRYIAVIYLIGCIGSWFVVLLLAGHAEHVSGFSPAVAGLTVGAVLGVVLTRPGASLLHPPQRRGFARQ